MCLVIQVGEVRLPEVGCSARGAITSSVLYLKVKQLCSAVSLAMTCDDFREIQRPISSGFKLFYEIRCSSQFTAVHTRWYKTIELMLSRSPSTLLSRDPIALSALALSNLNKVSFSSPS